MDRDYWTKQLREAEAALEAARRPTEVQAAAENLQHARAELKALGATDAKRPRADRRRDHSPHS
jgi:membrane protein involved in colicin uptake